MALISRLLAIVVLAFIAGAAALYFKLPGGTGLNNAFLAMEALQVQNRQRSSRFNNQAVFRLDANVQGVTRWEQEKTYSGFTLYSEGHGDTVRLIDMQGNVVHHWIVPYYDIWEDTGVIQDLVPDRFVFIRKVRAYPDGRLLMIFSAWATTPYGYGIAMVDKDSNVLWKDFRHLHHSFSQSEDGSIYVLDQELVTEAPAEYADIPTPYMNDTVSVYSESGEHLDVFSLLDSFSKSEFSNVIPMLALQNARGGLGDLLHSNDIEVLRADMADQFSFAEAGDLLISFREINAIAVIDSTTKLVKWFQQGYWNRQHDADFLDNGNMLIFDNVVMQRDPLGRNASRVIEFNPETREIVWIFGATEQDAFYSNARSSQQRLPNGNTLITASQFARILEVSPDGQIVWDYYNPVRLNESQRLTPAIFWAKRYAESEFAFELNGAPDVPQN